MMKNISYRKKLQLAGLGFVLLLLVCYRLAISATLKERKLYKQQTEALLEIQNPTDYFQQLQAKNEQLIQLFDQFALDTLNPSKNLLAVVSNYCNDHKLEFKEYKPLGFTNSEELKLLTRNISVEGSFLDCLGLVYELETKKKAGRVSSVLFKSYTDSKDKHTKLTCTLFIQNIITEPEKI